MLYWSVIIYVHCVFLQFWIQELLCIRKQYVWVGYPEGLYTSNKIGSRDKLEICEGKYNTASPPFSPPPRSSAKVTEKAALNTKAEPQSKEHHIKASYSIRIVNYDLLKKGFLWHCIRLCRAGIVSAGPARRARPGGWGECLDKR